MLRNVCFTLALSAALLSGRSADAETTLRIAMTAADIPTTTGLPNNGFEGMRFLGYPIFEALVLWDLTRTDQLAPLRPGLAEKWEQDPGDSKTWIFHLRHGVKFHDGTDFNADAVIWNLDRYFNNASPQFEAPSSAMVRSRVPLVASYKKIDDFTVSITTTSNATAFIVLEAIVALAVAWIAWGIARLRPWSRTPAVMTQVFTILIAIWLLEAHRWGWGLPALLCAIAALAGLFAPTSLRALSRPEG